ncbi:iron-containing alcohol dehydrogenase [Amphibacillus sediminis]|uniref:iron-containing alcohol dehydrogenase n=1 Tax=Amphibacillus sediminis TaxID=360185 RepID=UPI0008296DFB|nr:iron-containing alcohol dehydrogenase [Amphibacillus sediminis]
MDSFIFHNPTKLIFGKNTLQHLKEEIPHYGKRILLVYGGGSIKRNGIYQNVIQLLDEINATVFELSGVEPNPRVTTARKGVEICKQENIDFILAVGGGSTIDCVKAIAAGAKSEHDVWDIVTKKHPAEAALPFGTVLTLAATGSEMNSGSVITNWETNEKYGWGSPYTYPRFSILDPTHTITVPRDQTVYGIVDIMSHAFEHYFHQTSDTPLQDRMVEGLLKTVIETAPKLLNDLNSDQYRATILYCGTMALNGMVNMGYQGDWATHNLEHAVSAVHDIPHGGGLAILFPHWMEHVLDTNVDRFKQMASRVFDLEQGSLSDREFALSGIKALRAFWNSIGAPSRLSDYKITVNSIAEMADKTVVAKPQFGNFRPLTRDDAVAIYQASL